MLFMLSWGAKSSFVNPRVSLFSYSYAEMQHWLKDHGVGGYYAATVGSKSFSEGAKNCMNLVGLGKMAPNMVLAGFKQNWTQDLPGLREYIDVMYSALDLRLGFSILR